MKEMTFDLKHGAGNPRNSEGAFIPLNNGEIMFAYTKYSGDDWSDNSTADIAALYSADNGRSWGRFRILVKNPAQNVMSVSLLRLQDGRVAMAYLLKSSISGSHAVDCRPMICFSSDEAETWSEPVDIAGIPPVYLVVNNDRMIQLKDGRIVLPAAYHRYISNGNTCGYGRGIVLYFFSDDGGKSWQQASECLYPPSGLTSGFQEPGVIELSDGRLMTWIRTNGGCQYTAFSSDRGESWSQSFPASEFASPASPLSMKRHPGTGDLYAVWNDWHPCRSVKFGRESWGRTPLVIARSHDEGRTWVDHTVLENDPDCGYCYTAMMFRGDELLLAYCCGGKDCNVLQDLRIRVFEI